MVMNMVTSLTTLVPKAIGNSTPSSLVVLVPVLERSPSTTLLLLSVKKPPQVFKFFFLPFLLFFFHFNKQIFFQTLKEVERKNVSHLPTKKMSFSFKRWFSKRKKRSPSRAASHSPRNNYPDVLEEGGHLSNSSPSIEQFKKEDSVIKRNSMMITISPSEEESRRQSKQHASLSVLPFELEDLSTSTSSTSPAIPQLAMSSVITIPPYETSSDITRNGFISPRKFEIIEPIDGQKNVFIANYVDPHGMGRRVVAIKKLSIAKGSKKRHKHLQEGLIMRHYSESTLRNIPGSIHVVQYIDQFTHLSREHYLVMEYCDQGSLVDLIIQYDTRVLPMEILCRISHDMAMGLGFLHRLNIAHLDIKPDNILFSWDVRARSVVTKLADFGFSKILADHEDVDHRKCGTLHTMAPEVLNTKYYQALPVDVWALGACFFAISEGYYPFDTMSFEEGFLKKTFCMEQVKKNLRVPRENFHTPENFRMLTEGMLTLEPSQRYTIEDVIKSPWFMFQHQSNIPITFRTSLVKKDLIIKQS
jgi:hypothetical protein